MLREKNIVKILCLGYSRVGSTKSEAEYTNIGLSWKKALSLSEERLFSIQEWTMRSGCWHYNTALLEKCWWISLYETNVAIENLCDVKFSQI